MVVRLFQNMLLPQWFLITIKIIIIIKYEWKKKKKSTSFRSLLCVIEGWREQNELVGNVKVFSLKDLSKGRNEEKNS